MNEQTIDHILETFRKHLRIRNFLINICYFFIIAGLFIYIFYAFSHGQTAKLLIKYKEKSKEMSSEKVMINPRTDYKYKDGEIYHITATKAIHHNNQEARFYDVVAIGNMGKITAGELQVDEEGNRLIFTKDPVVILNKTSTDKPKTKNTNQ